MKSQTPQSEKKVKVKPLSHEEVHILGLQLHIMLSSGVPLMLALDSIANSELPRLAPACATLSKKIGSGFRLSEAMKSMDGTFSSFVTNLVVVGESSGKLPDVLQRVSERASRRAAVEREIKSALAYPFFLGVVSTLMAVFMGFYMFPKLLPFLSGLGVALPWPTRALIWITDNLSFFLLTGTLLAVWGVQLLISGSDPRIKRVREWFFYNSPLIGELNSDRIYADCLSDLGLLLEAGCDLMSGLKSINVPWPEYKARVLRCVEGIRSGLDFTEAVELSEMLPRKFLLQIKSGEETGKLAGVFKHLSKVLDDSVALRVNQIVQLMEPLILVVMGFITGFIVLATFMPLYSLASSSL